MERKEGDKSCWGVWCFDCGYTRAYDCLDSHWAAECAKRNHFCPKSHRPGVKTVRMVVRDRQAIIVDVDKFAVK